ncbi:MAG: response regulator [Archangium sp.]|nr:response regulator [Archangium sp.]
MNAPAKPLILYVEDDPDTFRLTQLRLQNRYDVIGAGTDVEASAKLKELGPTLYALLMDIELQGSSLDGLMLVKLVRGMQLGRPVPDYAKAIPVLPHLPIMVMTAYVTRYSEADVKPLGATQFLTKPIDFTRLNLALAQANIQSVMARLATQPRGR